MSTPISSINRNGPIGIPHSTSAWSILFASKPLSKSSAASSRYGNKTRFTRKPGLSRTITGNFPICRTKARLRSRASSDVSFATTTSTSFIRLTGLKKCRPMTCSGETVTSANSLTGSADVFVAMMVFGPASIASSRNTCVLMSIFSDVASITNCTSRNSIGAIEATMRARPSFAFSSVINPRFTASP